MVDFVLVVGIDFDLLHVAQNLRKNISKLNKRRLFLMVCKGVCPRYKTKCNFHRLRYANGQKRCNVCEVFVNWDGRFCPCCGMLLRTRPKISRYRRQYIEQEENNMEIST
jgi:hypothetical protein